MSDLIKALAEIQQKLKAPKGQYNKFGKYAYRNCEDILEALKPLLGPLALTMTDDIQVVGDRIYVKATVTLSDGSQSAESVGWAREALTKKGMDESQITGAASSYARKYALNGLFLTDDNKDADYAAGDDNAASKAPALSVWYASLGSARPVADDVWSKLSKEQTDFFNIQMKAGV